MRKIVVCECGAWGVTPTSHSYKRQVALCPSCDSIMVDGDIASIRKKVHPKTLDIESIQMHLRDMIALYMLRLQDVGLGRCVDEEYAELLNNDRFRGCCSDDKRTSIRVWWTTKIHEAQEWLLSSSLATSAKPITSSLSRKRTS